MIESSSGGGATSGVGSPAGTVHREDGRDVVEFRRDYPDPPAAVWAAVTESDRLARWFGSYTGDARPGGTVMVTMTSDEDGGGPPSSTRILECEPERRLVVEVEQDGSEPWVLTVTLEPAAAGTVFHFRQVLPPGFSPADAGPGWHWYLDRLGASMAGAPFPDWDDYYPALKPVYG